MDTLGPTKSVLIFQASLYDKAPFGTITKYVDYLFSSVLINRFHCPWRIAMYIIVRKGDLAILF